MAFFKCRSRSTNLLELTNFVFHAVSCRHQTDVIYMGLLLFKFDLIGFPAKLLSWISYCLTDITQRVIFKYSISRLISVRSGIPHESHLGPIL